MLRRTAAFDAAPGRRRRPPGPAGLADDRGDRRRRADPRRGRLRTPLARALRRAGRRSGAAPPVWCCSIRRTGSCCCTASSRPTRRDLVVHPGRRCRGGREPGGGGRREVAEETGITDLSSGPVLWQRSLRFDFDGTPLGAGRVVLPGPYRHRGLRHQRTDRPGTPQCASGCAGGPARNFCRTRETVYPTRLAGLLRTLLDEGPPPSPVSPGDGERLTHNAGDTYG